MAAFAGVNLKLGPLKILLNVSVTTLGLLSLHRLSVEAGKWGYSLAVAGTGVSLQQLPCCGAQV